MKIKYLFTIIIFCLTFAVSIGNLLAIPIDLTTFTANPASDVVINPDGSSATLFEDWAVAPVSFSNSSFSIPSDALSLSFDYALVVAAFNDDYFDFYINDVIAPDFWDGGPEGTYSGTYTYGLAALRGHTIPIIFNLMYGWGDGGYESYLTVSNVNLNPVPEPSTIFLLSIGILGAIGLRKKYLNA